MNKIVKSVERFTILRVILCAPWRLYFSIVLELLEIWNFLERFGTIWNDLEYSSRSADLERAGGVNDFCCRH